MFTPQLPPLDTSDFTGDTRSPPSSPDTTSRPSSADGSEPLQYAPSSPATSSSGSPRTELRPAPVSPAPGTTVTIPSESSSMLRAPSILPPVDLHIPLPRSESALRSAAAPKSPRPAMGIAHPYARLFVKKDGAKRRKIWNHALERYVFTPEETACMKAPQRRPIYIASLEAHIDALHAELLKVNLAPVNLQDVDLWAGLNSKIAKSLVAGLQQDTSQMKSRLRELERANYRLNAAIAREKQLASHTASFATVDAKPMQTVVDSTKPEV
ncbi:uncharacterized protein STEHIDRAFT_90387 [Stereum hirsutum FP-91666 SS1]|uniref:uncharacterized protein n=1 Tax=Stereum hirsutum (strain FP-91666) TaxID=721885 RepID=UPI000440A4A5|nr:uncharacterized protein STEHIDRAFT_90387 [Stereum hirsutum FP-91666 SS1]EIM92974.1 hypothetical protein STEHIDRAFT_90387 [Stereum hirsutum FP-91666 SS1]